MRLLILGLLLSLVVLQYKLFFGDGGLYGREQTQQQWEDVRQKNHDLAERNRLLADRLNEGRNKFSALEDKARSELGMIKRGEVFYWVVDPE